jgi:Spy/CpxP family protein refolding chaperone
MHGKGMHGKGMHGKGMQGGCHCGGAAKAGQSLGAPKLLSATKLILHAKWLELTDDQVGKLKALKKERWAKKADFMLQKKRAKLALKAEWLKDQPDPAQIQSLAKALWAVKQAKLQDKAEHLLKVKEVLTAEQYKKLLAKSLKWHGHGKPGMHGAGGHYYGKHGGMTGAGRPCGMAGAGRPCGMAGVGRPCGMAGAGCPCGMAGAGCPCGKAGAGCPCCGQGKPGLHGAGAPGAGPSGGPGAGGPGAGGPGPRGHRPHGPCPSCVY